jgi:hypothetical protein
MDKIPRYLYPVEDELPIPYYFSNEELGIEPKKKGGRKWKMPRKMTRKYCKKTPCKKMGFTQKASCRPFKNCYTRRKKKI